VASRGRPPMLPRFSRDHARLGAHGLLAPYYLRAHHDRDRNSGVTEVHLWYYVLEN
jgi:hypothetical protein